MTEGSSPSTRTPADLVARLFEESFNGRDPTVRDQLVAEDYLKHARPALDLTPHGRVDGREHLLGVRIV